MVAALRSLFGFGPDQTRIWWLSARQWVWLLISVSVAFQYYISWLSYAEFRLNSTDLSIWLQAYATNGHGRIFWTTFPYARVGVGSVLGTHWSWIIFAVYPVFVAFPSAFALFALQALVVAGAAIPLFLLTTSVTESQRKGLLAAGLYLGWAPLYVGLPQSFHLEAFFPLLFFTLVLLWYNQRYRLGFVVALLAAFSLDAAPIYTAAIGVWFLTFPAEAAWRIMRTRGRRSLPQIVRGLIRLKAVRANLALIAMSPIAFLLMRFLEANFVGWFGVSSSGLAIGRLEGFGFSSFWVNFPYKVEFWFILLATVGFLPFLYPRIFIVLVPWAGYVFLESQTEWVSLFKQYVAIAAVPLFLGVAFALREFPLRFPSSASPVPGPPLRGWSLSRPAKRQVFVIVVTGVVLLNLALLPLDPLTSRSLEGVTGPVFGGQTGPYSITTTTTSAAAYVQKLADLVPKDATGLVQSNLMPFVYWDPNAYGYNPSINNKSFDPFIHQLPQFVFTEGNTMGRLSSYVPSLSLYVWNNSIYGIPGWVPDTPVGSVFLFEKGYIGPSRTFGPTFVPDLVFSLGAGLKAGANTTTPKVTYLNRTGSVIASRPHQTGTIWTANQNGTALPAGSYTLLLTADFVNPTHHASCPPGLNVLNVIEGYPGEYPSAKVYFNLTAGECGAWAVLTSSFHLAHPAENFQLLGNRPTPGNGFQIYVASVEMSWTGP